MIYRAGPSSSGSWHIQVMSYVLLYTKVTEPCTIRMPVYFLVTVMSTDGVIIKTVQHPVATDRITTIRVTLDECYLVVRISAGNSAGISSPTETTISKLIKLHGLFVLCFCAIIV